ncbi:MAG: hypothetical protein Q8L34_04375 [Candidatus Woesearchaeota archaeon]|nr:hypothetical protein [Candidatus Woesearchaeota archaeon]
MRYSHFSNLSKVYPYQGAFAGYGDILQLGSAVKLEPGKQYTATIQFKNIIMPSESTVYEGVAKAFGKFATITSLDRGLFSSSFALTFTPSSVMGLNTTMSNIRNAFYPDYDATVVQVETGSVTTKPGGAVEAVKSITKKITAVPVAMASGLAESAGEGASNIATSFLKRAWPVLAIGAFGVFGYLYIASGAAKRRVGRM